MLKILLHKDNFDLLENGIVSTFKYNKFDSIINDLLNEKVKFKVLNEKVLPIRECKVIKLNDNSYRVLYMFDWTKSLCFQARHSYFKDVKTKNYALKQYNTLGMYSWASSEVKDIFNEKIISFII